jgi:putative FmdB family regulatory protein
VAHPGASRHNGPVPIYEYRCGGCRRKVTVLTLRVSEAVEAVCDHCGSRDLTRLMSRFATIRSEDSRLDALTDPSGLGDVDESDPKSMARWMKKMGQELGEEGGEDFDQMVEEMESGGDDADPDASGGEDES